jgi:hypothetical protein
MLKLVFEKSHFSSRLEIAVATNSLVMLMLMVALKKIGKLYEQTDNKASQIATICIFESVLNF